MRRSLIALAITGTLIFSAQASAPAEHMEKLAGVQPGPHRSLIQLADGGQPWTRPRVELADGGQPWTRPRVELADGGQRWTRPRISETAVA
jgi:hypothetical protein